MTTKPFVFITGMFRSGTTLIARMLHAHPQIAFASDPYARLFKAFRNSAVQSVLGAGQIDPAAPLDDYYFYPEKQRVMAAVQQTSFDLPAGALDLADLRGQIAQASQPYSPQIAPFLADLRGETFSQLFSSGLAIIERAYGDAQTAYLGLKEVWAGEFAPHLLDAFPQAKVIHVLRDPRAVSASKNVKNAKYPWLFLARQWRKLATLAWAHDQSSFPYHDRVLVVRFEALVADPTPQAQRLCDFLGLPFHENLTDPTTFTAGDGTPWAQNSSHYSGQQQFNTGSLDKWQETLTLAQIQFIESLCFAEMRVFDYTFKALEAMRPPLPLVFAPPEVAYEDLAEWIRPYSPPNQAALVREMALEYMRAGVLSDKETVSEAEKALLCLSPAFFERARAVCQPAML